ncbi:O-antigen ligase family protein [Silvimonas iriomotensis]|nr:O-antigen ligase family protein [Silvimonas iriomotensis]
MPRKETVKPQRLMSPPGQMASGFASVLVFAFPLLMLAVPRGAGVFLIGIVLLLIMSAGSLAELHRQYRHVLLPVWLSVGAILAVQLVSRYTFGLPWDVLDNPSRVLAIPLVCLVVLRYRPNPMLLWKGIPPGLLLALLIVAYQFFIDKDSRPGAWTFIIAFANMVATLGVVGFFRPGQTHRDHVAAWLCPALAMLVLIMNGSRGAWLALVLTVVGSIYFRYQKFNLKVAVISLCSLALIGTAAWTLPNSPFKERLEQARHDIAEFHKGNTDTSLGERLVIFQLATSAVRQHPLTGVGSGQFGSLTDALPGCPADEKEICTLKHAHNDLLDAAATTGLPGLAAFLSLLLVPGFIFWRAWMRTCGRDEIAPYLGKAGFGAVVASLICGFSQVTMAHQANIAFYASLIGLMLGLLAVRMRAFTQNTQDQP